MEVENRGKEKQNYIYSNQNRNKNIFDMEKVTEAEILYVFHSVETHKSNNSCNKTIPILQRMFPDSTIAQKMKLCSDKLSYLMVFGLAPYCTEILEESILRCDYFVACFDESLNRIAQKRQMDIVIRFWEEAKQRVQTR